MSYCYHHLLVLYTVQASVQDILQDFLEEASNLGCTDAARSHGGGVTAQLEQCIHDGKPWTDVRSIAAGHRDVALAPYLIIHVSPDHYWS